MNEVWKDIPGFEGIAKASNLGRIYKYKTNKIYDSDKSVNDYTGCKLWKDGTCFSKRIHQWIALTFIPNPENKPTVNHRDGNKWNNTVENLEWATYKENNDHAIKTGLNSYKKIHTNIQKEKATNQCKINANALKKRVVILDKNMKYIDTFNSTYEAAVFLGVSSSGVTRCCKGEYKYTGKHIAMFEEDYYETIY